MPDYYNNTISVNSVKAWLLASRPKTLSGATAPVLLGCALAQSDGCFQWLPALLCLLFAWFMQIDANLINDLFDYLKGSDGKERLGPERACAQGWITVKAMKYSIVIVTAVACLAGSGLLFYGGFELLGVGLVCVLFAFLYTAGPYPLAYHGWGDLLVLLFFGLVPVGCTYYIMAHTWTVYVTIAAIACGLAVDTLLMVNNYRDREQDARNGKKTLVVLLGEHTGSLLYLISGLLAPLLCLFFIADSRYAAAFLPLIYIPLHLLAWKRIIQIKNGKALNSILGETSRNILIFALSLSLGLLL